MSSEPTDRHGADEEVEEAEESSEEERLEARAQEPTRVDETEEAEAGEAADKSVISAPSDADEQGEEGLAEDSSEVEADQGEEGLAEDSSEAEADQGEEGLAEDSSEAEAEEAEAEDEQQQEEDEEEDEEEEQRARSRFTDLEDQAREWLDGLFERMNFDAEADLRWEEDRPLVDIGGPDAERLLGRGKLGPKAIEGIETLLQSVFSEDDAARDVYVDVDGKRAARKEMLQEVAVSMADKAVELDRKIAISGLNSTERRIIHRRLRDYDGVDTESVGDGIFRRLTIEPTH